MSALAPADSFDEQPHLYDARAGLPAAAAAAAARAVVEVAGVGGDDLVVEVGAGTGEIGADLARLPLRYVGLDRSAPMLRVFRTKVGDRRPSLIQADCDRAWPLRDGVAAVVFASRVAHLLNAAHVTRETLRVCHPAGWLVLGGVVRDQDGVKERLRRHRRDLLAAAGFAPRQGEGRTRHLAACCRAAGGTSLGRRIVAEWTGEMTPAAVIADWEPLSRMGAVAVDPVTRMEILAELRRWAVAEFGDLQRSAPFREQYVVEVVRLPRAAVSEEQGS